MTLTDDLSKLQARMAGAVKTHWKAFLIEGIVLVLLGLAAILVPPFASLAVAILLGWMFIISGAVQLWLTISAKGMPGFGWALLSALFAIVAGIVLLLWPVQGVLSLTVIVGVYFVMEGVATIMYALAHRRELTDRWGFLVAAGIADIVVAGLIVAGLPGSAS